MSFRTQFRIAAHCRAFILRIFSYLHSSHITFIGLLPLFIFFVKVPFGRGINHFRRTSFNKISNHFRPLVGRDLRVRRSIPVLFNFSRSYNGHCTVPPFHLFPASFVPRLRFPSKPRFFSLRALAQVLGYFYIRRLPPNGKESSLFVPSFLVFFRRIPTALCQPSLLSFGECFICSLVCPLF